MGYIILGHAGPRGSCFQAHTGGWGGADQGAWKKSLGFARASLLGVAGWRSRACRAALRLKPNQVRPCSGIARSFVSMSALHLLVCVLVLECRILSTELGNIFKGGRYHDRMPFYLPVLLPLRPNSYPSQAGGQSQLHLADLSRVVRRVTHCFKVSDEPLLNASDSGLLAHDNQTP